MYVGKRQTEEADSDSDWDSLSGVAEPQSDNEPTPRLTQPTSPNNHSTRIQTPNIKNTSTPIKSNTKSTSKSATNANPSKLYGKSGVTTFVDRSDDNITTYDSANFDRRRNIEPIPEDPNSNKISRRKEKAMELNELDFHPVKDGQTNMGFHSADDNPPYMDFKDALPKHEMKQEGRRPEQKRGKKKSAYIRNQTPDHVETPTPRPALSDHSWDESDQENGPEIFHSSTPRMTNHRQPSKTPNSSKPSAENQEYAVDVNIPDDETCCVPYQKKTGNGHTYVFNHGKFQYFSVVPEWREPYMKTIGERTERWLSYFWQEFFGAVGLLVDFALIFIFEFIKFTFHKVLVRLLVGFIVVLGDYLLKPTLTALFNSLLQPSLSFTWNVLVGLRKAVEPLLDITREIVMQATTLLKGFRLFELNWKPTLDTNVKNARALSHQHRIQEI